MSESPIEKICTRAVSKIIEPENLRKKLNSGKKLRIKFGIDPTGSDLTLGHAIALRKLKQFQDLGHTIIFLFGGYTATIGDPTGKNETRPPLTLEQVEENAKTYLDQAAKILDIEKCEIRNNRDWFEKMSLAEGLKLLAQKSAQQILARKDFKDRFSREIDVHLHELTYPLLQGYDSVVLESDVEIGGNDQLFNILVGRDMQKKYECKILQEVLTVNLLVGTDGSEKMSKSLGNYIGLNEVPKEIFGKIMSIPDAVMMDYFEGLTDIDLSEAQDLIEKNPRDAKVFLAKNIIAWLHDDSAADKAEQDFVQKFVKKEIPDEIEDFLVSDDSIRLIDLITEICQFTQSKSETRRLITQGAVSLEGQKIVEPNFVIEKSDKPLVLKAGKRNFGRIVFG